MKIKLFLIGFFLFIATSCNNFNPNTVEVSAGFADEVRQSQNLVFLFNKEVYKGAEIGKWLDADYLDFSPKVAGKYQWKNEKELVFSPSNSFMASTKYTVKVKDEILKNAENNKLKLDNKTTKFEFSTPLFRADEFQVYWGVDNNNQIGLIANVFYNYPINFEENKNLISFYDEDDKVINATFIPDNFSDKQTKFILDIQKDAKKSFSIKTKIDKGLKIKDGGYKTTTITELTAIVAEKPSLTILDVTTDNTAENQKIIIKFSQQISAQTLQNNISLSPTLDVKMDQAENMVILEGKFNTDLPYQLTISKNIKGIAGGEMKEDYIQTISFKPKDPSISFLQKKGMYLSSAGLKNVAIQIDAVKEVNLKVYKVYENNILAYSRGNSYYYYDEYDGDDYGQEYQEDDQGNYSSKVVDRTINTADLPTVEGTKILHLDIPESNNLKGVYYVKVSSSEDYYVKASKLISISDIGLIVKSSDNQMVVYANSILTAKPLKDIEISIISKNNQNITTIKTNGNGMARIEDFKKIKGDFEPYMVTAKTKTDFNYVMFNKAFVETSRFEVEGARKNDAAIDAYIYGDRNLYRPGDTVHIQSILRDAKKMPVTNQLVKIKVRMPNGIELINVNKETDEQGGVSLDFPTSAASLTGNYNIQIFNGSEVLLNSRNINIEEFMPDRISVALKTNKERYQINEKIKLEVNAQNYFGPPSVNRNVEAELILNRNYFSPKGFEAYQFGNNNNNYLSTNLQTSTTNEKGISNFEFEIPASYKEMGMLKATIYTTVFDETGRAVNRVKEVEIQTQEVMYGVNIPEYYIATNQQSEVLLAALNADGKPMNADVQVKIVRYDWQNSLYRRRNNYGYNSDRKEIQIVNKVVKVTNGKYTLKFLAPVSGEYEVRVSKPGSVYYAAAQVYAYTYGNASASSFNINNEGTIDIVFDKEKYEVGEKAKILFKTPFNGKMMLSLEKDEVIKDYEIEVKNKSAELTIDITKEHLPNIYIAATLIKPLVNIDIPLTVAHGYQSLSVEDKNTKIALEIIAPEESRSSKKQKIKVKTGKANVPVTIAIVDEGILSLKNFQTPDPHKYFYAKRALEVNSYDMYPFLFPEMATNSSSGGDGFLADMAKRVNPMANPRVKLLAYWSGVIKTNANGEAEYEIDIPKFSGQLRIMAVAYKDAAFGTAEKDLKIADPLVVVSAVPRFLSPGDELEMPVSISNTTKNNASVNATVSVDGALELVDATPQKISINSKNEGRVVFRLKAKGKIGQAKIKVSVQGLNETFTDITELTVRPASSLVKLSGSEGIGNGESAKIDFNNLDFMSISDDYALTVSNNPLYGMSYKLADLIGYPHGCLEQTVSKAFPQLYVADLFSSITKNDPKAFYKLGENELNPKYNIAQAIDKISRLQYYNGSFSYWPGGDYFNNWSSVYATHFLLEAKKAGYTVDNNVLDNALNYVNSLSNYRNQQKYYYYDAEKNQYTYKMIHAHENIYAVYVLASAGKPNKASMNFYKTQLKELSADERYMLAAAFKLSSDPASAKAVLPSVSEILNPSRITGGSFYSPIRNLAVSLNSLIETNPSHADVFPLTKKLVDAISKEKYLNTQEQAFSMLALGKIAKLALKNNNTITIKSNGKVIKEVTGQTPYTLKASQLRNTEIEISSTGNGIAYYSWRAEGISSTGKIKEEDNLISVRKTFYDRNGNPLSGNEFKQNDLVVVKLSFASLDGTTIENVVITDLLPACFEIENPRINEGREYSWFKDRAYPKYFDIRDDRINYFLDVSTTQNLYYLIRVVNKGTYQMGVVSADAMYDGNYHSYYGARSVVVR